MREVLPHTKPCEELASVRGVSQDTTNRAVSPKTTDAINFLLALIFNFLTTIRGMAMMTALVAMLKKHVAIRMLLMDKQ